MVAGIDVDLFRPDEELKSWPSSRSTSASATGSTATRPPRSRGCAPTTPAAVARAVGGLRRPWFNFSSGSGFYHSDRVWADYPDIPMGFVADYVAAIGKGETLERPMAAVEAERDRIVAEYSELIDGDENRAVFEGKLGLARTVFPYVENHNFYVEHWGMSQVWGKMRQLGQVLTDAGFFETADDIFLLRRTEVPDAIFDYFHGWAVGIPSRGPQYWGREIPRRQASCRRCAPGRRRRPSACRPR